MSYVLLAGQLIIFCGAWWLGCYLLGRGWAKPALLLTGLGLLSYALGVAASAGAPAAGALWLAARQAALLLPALCWAGVLVALLPAEAPRRALLVRGWRWGAGLAAAGGLSAIARASGQTVRSAADRWLERGLAALALGLLLAALLALLAAWRAAPPDAPTRSRGAVVGATLLWTLGSAALLLPRDGPAAAWLTLALSADLALLGWAIARWDAFDEGETLRRDMLRSGVTAALVSLLFGGQLLLAARVIGLTPALLAALHSTLALAIALAAWLPALQSLLDRLVFADDPALRSARAALRDAGEALPRAAESAPAELGDEDFARLVRQALSHYHDLPRLTINPLTRLPGIEARLGASDNLLERAAALKALLTESIARLKPQGQGEFGSSSEWRHYNALYFPYVVGLKPYSRRGVQPRLEGAARQALDWFQAEVPERTLYNWQRAAARLVADDLAASLKTGGAERAAGG